MTNRRENISRGLVNWPKCGPEETYYNTGEGGMECWLVIRRVSEKSKGVRDVCITGFQPGIVAWDVITSEEFSRDAERQSWAHKRDKPQDVGGYQNTVYVDCAVCIGATGLSPYKNGDAGNYWQATYEDLTDDGKALYQTLKKLYDIEPELVMALDT